MKNGIFSSLLALVFGTILFSNCASLTGFSDGRVVGNGNLESSSSLNYSATPDFREGVNSIQFDRDSLDYFPLYEHGVRYGLTDKIDIGFRANTFLNVAVDAKFQVLGNRDSKTALSISAGGGTFGLPIHVLVGLWNFQVSAPFSVHPTDRFTWYLAPRFVGQFATTSDGPSNLLRYSGGNTGLLYGEKVKFGLDFGYYRWSAGGESVGLFQFGGGMKFRIGNNESSSSLKSKKKK